jgi:ubiquinone biosynthesis monooxygenase Coq7
MSDGPARTGDTSAPVARTGDGRLPGDLPPRDLVERIIRVDHAGEYGARRIYEGQLAVLAKGSPAHGAIRAMAEQERRHLAAFDTLIAERRVRPTALMPLWHVAGFALGAATALLGERAAMACTIAVEEVIDAHYAGQLRQLGDDEAALRGRLEEFRAHEIEHKAVAEAHHGRDAGGYELLSVAIKAGSRLAIWLSERI